MAADRHGIRRVVHVQLFTLFTREEYERAFDRAGFDVEYLSDPEGVHRRRPGLFVGIRRAAG